MAPKWLIGAFLLFAIMGMVNGMIEGWSTGQSWLSELSILMTGWNWLSSGNPLMWIPGVVLLPFGILQACFNAFFWQYSFLAGGWQIIRWTVLIPINVGILISMLLAMRGTSSG